MLKRYDVIVFGNRTTLLLSDADAAARGLLPVPAPQPKADVPTKAKTPANKARKTANKSVEAALGPRGAE